MPPKKTVQRVNVDFPVDFLRQIDAEADRIGVSRQSFIKYTVARALDDVPVPPRPERGGK